MYIKIKQTKHRNPFFILFQIYFKFLLTIHRQYFIETW